MIDRRWTFLVVTSGKPSPEVEPQLATKDAQSARTSAISAGDSVGQHVIQQIEIATHLES